MESNVEIPFLEKKSSKSLPEEAQERREEILKLINLSGIDNVRRRQKALSEKYKVSDRTIRNDINWIIGHYKPDNIREIKINLKVARDRALQEALELINETNDPKIKSQAIQALNSTMKIYREELEAWGEKTKIADKTDVNITGYKFELIRAEKSKV